ncbi:MAG TPA: hypothetical protein ENI08_01895 [Candidatus Dependentiae bacterium]|nr:hypothetical protein [Candidatus Dependentiae bacterium]
MRTSFVIYFLFTIMIGNVLHASEKSLVRQEELSASQDSTNLMLLNLEVGVDSDASSEGELKTLDEELRESQPMVNDGIITSLAELAIAVQRKVEDKQTRSRKSKKLDDFLKIPNEMVENDKLKISPALFSEYIDKEIKLNPEPGWVKRVFCCRRKKNPLEYTCANQTYQYKMLSKKIVAITVYQKAIENLDQKPLTRTVILLANIDDNEESKTINSLEIDLLKEKLRNERFKTKEELAENLKAILEDQKQEDDKHDTMKQVMYTIAGLIGSFFAGNFGG